MRARICITTSYDDKYREMGELCRATLIRYAQTFGYDTRIFENRTLVRGHSWDKILIIQELFAEGYEFVFWVDADTLFVRFDRDIGTEIVPDKHLYLTLDTQITMPTPGVLTTVEVPLAGFLLVRNVEWSHRLLETLWNSHKHLNIPISDNMALFKVLGYHYMLDLYLHRDKRISEQQNRPDPRYWEFIKRLDPSWHTVKVGPDIESAPDPVVIHYPALPTAYRLLAMHADYARYVTQTTPSPVTAFDLDFSQPVDGDGWYMPEYSQVAKCGFRWSGRKTAMLNIPLAPGHDYTIRFRLLQTLGAETREQFQVRLNDTPIALEYTPADDYGFHYTGVIPQAALDPGSPLASLAFLVQKLHTPQEFEAFFDSNDTRLLGVAIAELHIQAR